MADYGKHALNDGIDGDDKVEEVMDTSNPPDADQDMGEGGDDQADATLGTEAGA